MSSYFSKGDIVEFELSKEDSSWPRWNDHKPDYDGGASGKFITALVSEVINNKVVTVYISDYGRLLTWYWFPSQCNTQKPGYLKRSTKRPFAKFKVCTCGGTKTKTTHSHWCDSL